MSHDELKACMECSYTYSENSQYIRHYISMHSDICPYICQSCENVFISDKEVQFHNCVPLKKHQETVVISEIPPSELLLHEDRILLALNALPEPRTREKILQWILNNVPPPPLYISSCKQGVYSTLKKKFHQNDTGWLPTEIETSKKRTPVDRLVSIAFHSQSFCAMSAHDIYEAVKKAWPSHQPKTKAIASISRHLTSKEGYQYQRDGTTNSKKKKGNKGYVSKGKDLWIVINNQSQMKSKAEMSQMTIHPDPGLTYTELVLLALQDKPKTRSQVYSWISEEYPFHQGHRKRVTDTMKRLKLVKQGECYSITDGLQTRRKRRPPTSQSSPPNPKRPKTATAHPPIASKDGSNSVGFRAFHNDSITKHTSARTVQESPSSKPPLPTLGQNALRTDSNTNTTMQEHLQEHQQVHGSAAVRGTGLRQSDSSSSMPGVLIDRP
ncbi:hypothetical protein IFR05_017144, partial [Cadophora sp. M221]